VSFALVLAGGGVTGIAWETGVLLGLRDEGVDVVAAADLVVGTSAGSTVGAQILSGTDLAQLYERQLGPHQELSPEFDLERLIEVFTELAQGDRREAALLRRVGEMALAATTVPEAERRAVIEWRLPSHDWPTSRLLIPAVDAGSGELVVFDAASGVGLVDAVAASCAVPGVWPPVTIGDCRYIDGGVRSTANADLAANHDGVLVLAPLAGPVAAELDAEVEALRAAGSGVVAIVTDDDAVAAMGPNPLDPGRRPEAAEHGRRQGAAAATTVGALLGPTDAG
jgi:NTE family protein